MRLSEAMRLGAMALPPAYGPVFEKRDGVPCGACAVGAALYAVGRVTEDIRFVSALTEQWPWLASIVEHPIHNFRAPVIETIVGLFELAKWDRDRIADWIATIEP